MIELLFDEYLYYTITAILILLIVFISLKLKKSVNSSKKEEVIICGPSNTGKTQFFYQLISNKPQLSVASMIINSQLNVEIKKSKNSEDSKSIVKVSDIPGIGYFKTNIIASIPSSKIIVLFIDSSDKKSIVEAAEYAYDIINDDMFDESVNLLIACNKMDSKFAKSKNIIESELGTEIDSRKQIKQKNNLEDQLQLGKLFVS